VVGQYDTETNLACIYIILSTNHLLIDSVLNVILCDNLFQNVCICVWHCNAVHCLAHAVNKK